jgi:hypothetical protein
MYLIESLLIEIGGELKLLVGQLVLFEGSDKVGDELLGDAVVEFFYLVDLCFHC